MNRPTENPIALQNYVFKNANRNDIQNIIDTIDKFGWNEQQLMNIGDRKGKILDEALQRRKPKSVLELGTYIGYSSLRIVSQLPNDAIFITIEGGASIAEIARSIHEYAGVENRIKIVNDLTDNAIPNLRKNFHIDSFDFIFMDHYKEYYLRDFKLLEDTGLIKSGTMIFADNIICPGAPDYKEYIENNPNYTTTFHETTLEYTDNRRDAVAISIRK